jgi:hypothetical protein
MHSMPPLLRTVATLATASLLAGGGLAGSRGRGSDAEAGDRDDRTEHPRQRARAWAEDRLRAERVQ